MTTRSVECSYNQCGKPFTSKARMKEHVLWHLEVDPPKPIQQHALVRYRTSGGWTVVKDLQADIGEGSSSGRMTSQADSEVDKFRLTDILPLTTDSQVGNITTTTTTSGGTVSQPISFSPVLPDRPSQLSLPSQTLPTPARSDHPTQSSTYPLLSINTSRDPLSPFVHSAPKISRPRATDSPASPTSIARRERRRSTKSPTKRARTSASPFVLPEGKDLISSTPRSTGQGSHASQLATPSDSSQYPPRGEDPSPQSGQTSGNTSLPISTAQQEGVKRTFGFGEAVGSKPTTVQSGVTFTFAAPR